MRTIIILIAYILIAILSIPMYLLEFIISKINDKAAAKLAQSIVCVVFKMVLFISGCKKEIIGIENIPDDTPVMYAANHRSFYDIILAYSTVPNQTAFISKIEIKKMPCVAQWMYFLHCQFMERGIALKGKCPIVPVCIHGTEKIFENHLPWIHSGKIRIEYGTPIYPDQLDKQEQKHIGAYVHDVISNMYHAKKEFY